jgi:hypothetical protein
MTSRQRLLRNLRLLRGGGAQSSGGAGARRGDSQLALHAAGSAAVALVALACAFGPMPDRSALRDAAGDEAEVGVSHNTIDNFLADSRRHLGL